MGRRRTDGWRDEGLTDRLLFPPLSPPLEKRKGEMEKVGEKTKRKRERGKKSGGGKKGDITDGWREERKFFFSVTPLVSSVFRQKKPAS